MRPAELLMWTAATTTSLLCVWQSVQRPPAVPTFSIPPERARVPTLEEQQAVTELAARVLDELRLSAAANGRTPSANELEGLAPNGEPWLPSGLPDNPFVEGVAGVSQICSPDSAADSPLDWTYCPEPLRFTPSGVVSAGP